MDVLVVTTEDYWTRERRDTMERALAPVAKELGMRVILLDAGMEARIERDLSPLVAAVTAQTEAIGLLIEALVDQGESGEEEAAEAVAYLSGRKIN